MPITIDQIIRTLELSPHPEGGYFRESFRSPTGVEISPNGSVRAASTAIYFLLTPESFSAFHRVNRADELWHHYIGEPVELHLLSEEFGHQSHVLGSDLETGQRPQIVVPAGTFQAARTIGAHYSLCGCTVAPGFEFTDWEMPSRESLLRRFPEHAALITQFTER
ncbi:MAG: hypothetical protein Kow0074_07580 [Candidatus Zixiibacteriota bacterium]